MYLVHVSCLSTHVDRACQIRFFSFLPSFRFRFPFHLTCIVYPAPLPFAYAALHAAAG